MDEGYERVGDRRESLRSVESEGETAHTDADFAPRLSRTTKVFNHVGHTKDMALATGR